MLASGPSYVSPAVEPESSAEDERLLSLIRGDMRIAKGLAVEVWVDRERGTCRYLRIRSWNDEEHVTCYLTHTVLKSTNT